MKARRDAKGFTQVELAKRAGVAEAYVSMIESEKRTSPSLPVLQRLATALGVRVQDLFP